MCVLAYDKMFRPHNLQNGWYCMQHFRKRITIWNYIRIFLSAFIALLILGITSQTAGWPSESFTDAVREFWFVPVFMVLFMVFYHLSRRIFDRNYGEQDEAQDYLVHMSKKVRRDLKFGKEEFQKLREDETFQQFFQEAYEIFQQGETPDLNYRTLNTRFEESDFAYEPARLIIEETKELRRKYKKDKKPSDS